MENLNDKVWYRLLKVIFIIAFLITLPFALFSDVPTKAVYRCNNSGKIIPFSHNSTINDVLSFRVDKECNPNVVVPTYGEDGNYTEAWMRSYVSNYQAVNIIDYWEVIWFYPLMFFSVCFLFWLISRIFFYVVTKDKFLSGRLVNMLKKPFTKK